MNRDPLLVFNPRKKCFKCKGVSSGTSTCEECQSTGYQKADFNNIWFPHPGFLVCSGPSLKNINYNRLSERGVVSLGINNISAKVPVTAWCYGDGPGRFHHGLFLDPKILTFGPYNTIKERIRAKLPDGSFKYLDLKVKNMPNTFTFLKKNEFSGKNFFKTSYAQWGKPKLTTLLYGIRLMHYLGCTKIYLLGVDHFTPDPLNPYAFEPSKKPRRVSYDWERKYLSKIKKQTESMEIKIYNCNPDSKCDLFEFVSFEDAIKDCKQSVPNEPFFVDNYYDLKAFNESEESKTTITKDQLKQIQNR
jgi:hypothetical protein